MQRTSELTRVSAVPLVKRSSDILIRLIIWAFELTLLPIAAAILFNHTDVSGVEFTKTVLIFTLIPAPLLLFAKLWQKQWLHVLLLVLPSWIVLTHFVLPQFNQAPSVPPDTPQLTVLTFNVFRNGEGADAIEQIIRDSDADIIAIQELGDRTADILSNRLEDLYPYQALHPQSRRQYYTGQGIFSKIPITSDEFWRYNDLPYSQGQQRIELDFNGTPLAFYNVHPWSSVHYDAGVRLVFSDSYDASHSGAVEHILERVTQETLPVIMAGDFNMSDLYEEYDDVTAHFVDSFREAGRGMGYTYPSDGIGPIRLPLIRLDYVFHSAQFKAVAAKVWPDAALSDHHPVRVELAFVGSDQD